MGYKFPNNYKGKNSDSIIKKSAGHYLNQVIQVNIIDIRTNQHNVPPDILWRKKHHEEASDRETQTEEHSAK